VRERSLATGLVFVLLASALWLTAGNSTAEVSDWRWNRCRFQGVNHLENWTEYEVHLTIHCAVRKFPTSHDTADYVADRESGMGYNATNSSSGACGIYQHLPRYWPDRVDSFRQARPAWRLKRGCYNARSNVLVAIRMASTGGWGPWSM
jgi:hypothetical protein